MLIAISGGIGSGKSVVCRILQAIGYEVYDCDSRARTIMDTDESIKQRIANEVSAQAVTAEGAIDRTVLANVVFADAEKLLALNAIVHGAVRSNLEKWHAQRRHETVFVETAILYQSGLDKMVDEVWEVVAPEDTRIKRVCRRNNISAAQVRARIESQHIDVREPHTHTYAVVNDESHSLLLQINALLERH